MTQQSEESVGELRGNLILFTWKKPNVLMVQKKSHFSILDFAGFRVGEKVLSKISLEINFPSKLGRECSDVSLM